MARLVIIPSMSTTAILFGDSLSSTMTSSSLGPLEWMCFPPEETKFLAKWPRLLSMLNARRMSRMIARIIQPRPPLRMGEGAGATMIGGGGGTTGGGGAAGGGTAEGGGEYAGVDGVGGGV